MNKEIWKAGKSMDLYGHKATKSSIIRRVGDISQLAGAQLCELKSGKSKGTDAIFVKTGAGLNFTVLPDRGMDIAWSDYKGISIGYISKTGIVSPVYFHEQKKEGFLKNFFAGLLTTAGLTHMGAPCTDEGVELGLHGVISNIPAEDVCLKNEWDGDDYVMEVNGKVRQSIVYGENLVMKRVIKTKLGSKKIEINDAIENAGFIAQPFMMLYHFNFGYPILSEDSVLYTPKTKVVPRTDDAKNGLSSYNVFHEPKKEYIEKCFYLDMETNREGFTYACLFNEALNLGVYVKYNKKQLPYFVLWKQLGEQEYVVGLNPATWYAEGRKEARCREELLYIQSGETKNITIEIGIIEDKKIIEKII